MSAPQETIALAEGTSVTLTRPGYWRDDDVLFLETSGTEGGDCVKLSPPHVEALIAALLRMRCAARSDATAPSDVNS